MSADRLIRSARNVLPGWSRRNFLGRSALSATVPLFARGAAAETVERTRTARDPGEPIPLTLDVNGQKHRLALDGRVTLLDGSTGRRPRMAARRGGRTTREP